MNRKVDVNQVRMMDESGLSRAEIARRLGVNERTVRRVLGPKAEPAYLDNEVEVAVRSFYGVFNGPAAVAERFGVTRQAIYKNNKRSA